ncbi:MAG: DedA family protein [Chloroflexi bacterium]|nr:MAG: DedA family protein [Chloroflexota bacterium]
MAAMEHDLTVGAAVAPPTPPRRIGWQDVLIVGPIIANSIYYYAGLPLNALLLGTHPILLSLIRGSTVAMIASGGFASVGRAPLILALLAPVPISMITDPCYFYAGRRYGRGIVHYLERTDPRWRRRLARGERFFKRWGVWTVVFAPFIPVPSALFYLAAGEAGMRFIIFILADLAGTLMYVGLWVGAGWIAGQHAVDVAQTITHYGWWIVGGTLLLVTAWAVWSSRRSRQVT